MCLLAQVPVDSHFCFAEDDGDSDNLPLATADMHHQDAATALDAVAVANAVAV